MLVGALMAAGGRSQDPELQPPQPQERRDVRLPNGKRQSDEILKAEYRKNLDDAEELLKLSQALKDQLDKSDAFVLSLGAIRKTEDIEKLAKRIRGRLKGQ